LLPLELVEWRKEKSIKAQKRFLYEGTENKINCIFLTILSFLYEFLVKEQAKYTNFVWILNFCKCSIFLANGKIFAIHYYNCI
jgi:hypothetical protein